MKLRKIYFPATILFFTTFIIGYYFISRPTTLQQPLLISGSNLQGILRKADKVNVQRLLNGENNQNNILPQREDKIYYGTNEDVDRYFNGPDFLSAYRNNTDPNLSKRFPRCICIGSMRGGTKALVEFLDLHPQVKSAPNETRYFAYGERFDMAGYERYLKKMPYSSRNQITFEKSTQYTASIDRRAANRMHKFDPSMQLLYVVRDPIDRAYSQYLLMGRQDKNSNKTFQDFIFDEDGSIRTNYPPVRNSMYYDFLTGWYEYFPANQIHIVDGDNLVNNPAQEMEQVEDFLNIDRKLVQEVFYLNHTKGFHCFHTADGKTKCLPEGNRHPVLDPEVSRKLQQFYAPLNEKFYNLVGQRFDW